jgi:hypothetical protein
VGQTRACQRFLTHMLTRNIRIEENLIDLLFNNAEKRLARTLLLMARYGEEQDSHRALPRVSQTILAEMVGTTRSRVNVFMMRFRKLGFIDYNGTLKVHNSLLTVLLRDAPSSKSGATAAPSSEKATNHDLRHSAAKLAAARITDRCLDDAIAGAVTEYARGRTLSRDGEPQTTLRASLNGFDHVRGVRTGRVGVGGAQARCSAQLGLRERVSRSNSG